ncbi:acetylcholine receptor subunit alpha-type acr-16-like [Mya arenaria]|uniref:acetylcholine receptor subunit alpha-type acr-16-like n=1 Tax=Mya arenaria TaxID=6604 RepID=UPI0022E283FE|nr:acetylcholine receptor subunit alpha-type acr-16-like [Mya arenaria]
MNYMTCIVLLCLTAVYGKNKGGRGEEHLLKKLFRHYNKLARPEGDHVEVAHALYMRRIIALHEKDTVVGLDVLEHQTWIDNRFIWDPMSFSNVTLLHVPSDVIWKPDIVLSNSANEYPIYKKPDFNVIISNDGLISYSRLQTIYAYGCQNTQEKNLECKLGFHSLTYTGFDLKLKNETAEIGLDDFDNNLNPTVMFVSGEVIREDTFFACCPEPYSSVTYTLILKKTVLGTDLHKQERPMATSLPSPTSPSTTKEKQVVWSESSARLIPDLMSFYSNIDLPPSSGPPLTVGIGMSIYMVTGDKRDRLVDNIMVRLTFEGYMWLTWQDMRLSWSPEKYSGSNAVYLPLQSVWAPDIKHQNSSQYFNGRQDTPDFNEKDVRVEVRNDGTVSYIRPVVLSSYCIRTPMSDNEVRCNMTFASLTYPPGVIRMTHLTSRIRTQLEMESSAQETSLTVGPRTFSAVQYSLKVGQLLSFG